MALQRYPHHLIPARSAGLAGCQHLDDLPTNGGTPQSMFRVCQVWGGRSSAVFCSHVTGCMETV